MSDSAAPSGQGLLFTPDESVPQNHVGNSRIVLQPDCGRAGKQLWRCSGRSTSTAISCTIASASAGGNDAGTAARETGVVTGRPGGDVMFQGWAVDASGVLETPGSADTLRCRQRVGGEKCWEGP